MAAFRYREECYGHSGGQTDCSILAYDDKVEVGHLDIAYHSLNGRKEAYIKMIEVNPDYRGKGVGRGLIHQLAKVVTYDSIDWGNTTEDGAALKAKMDKEFGTSYKPVEKDEEPDPWDPKYGNDSNNQQYYADLEAWRKRQGYVDESAHIYRRGKTVMKIKELKQLIQEAVNKSLREAGYDQYGENLGDQTSYAEEANALYENHVGFKNLVHKLQGQGHSADSAKKIAYSVGVKKYGKEKMSKAASSHKALSDKDALKERIVPGDQTFYVDFDEATQLWCIFGDHSGKCYKSFASPEEAKLYLKNSGMTMAESPKHSCPKCKSSMVYDDGRDAYVCKQCGYVGPNGPISESPPPGWHGTVAAMKQHHPDKFGDGPGKINPYALANSMAKKGDHPHYKDQKTSLHGTPVKKKGQ